MAEPVAMVALALQAHEMHDACRPATDWLAERQNLQGEVGVMHLHNDPGWNTPWAMIVWHQSPEREAYRGQLELATQWLLGAKGKVLEPDNDLGHNVQLVGWSWAPNTHSWIEPTSAAVLALRTVGLAGHERTLEGIQLLVDRQLPAGGCNYGNTFVLGQLLRPHVQPTGIAMAALAGSIDPNGRLIRSLGWLKRQLSGSTTCSSLAWGLLGLAAHQQLPSAADEYLDAVAHRQMMSENSPYKMAMLLLASAASRSFLRELVHSAPPSRSY